MMNKLFKVMGGLLAAVAMMLGFLGVGTAHADEVIDNGGIVTRALENTTAVYAELDARNSPVGLDSAGDTLWVRFVQNGVELSSVPSPFQPRQRNVLQLPVKSGSVTWEVFHVSRPTYVLAAGRLDLRFPDDFGSVYDEEGYLEVNGRYWHTTCESYSQTERCRTEIRTAGGWAFNNLTYLPSPRSLWANNPLGGYGKVGNKSNWTSGGRQWRVECDTAATGRGGCRSYIKIGNQWVFNNIVRFIK